MELEQRLSNLVEALGDATRGAILLELEHQEERTPTQLARALGVSANNVYHHMRVLRRLEVVAPPRAVPGPTYVEKYYRLHPDLVRATRDPFWLDQVLEGERSDVHRRLMAAELLLLAHLLRRAAALTAALSDEQVREQRDGALAMVSTGRVTRPRYLQRLERMRAIVSAERDDAREAADDRRGQDLVIMVGIPALWRAESDASPEPGGDSAAPRRRTCPAGATKNRPEP